MNDDEWMPFGLDEEEAEDYAVLLPGVPEWLLEPLIIWLGRFFHADHAVRTAVALQAQLVTRIDLGAVAGRLQQHEALRNQFRVMEEDSLLRVVDYVLSERYRIDNWNDNTLDPILRDGRSKWQVGVRQGKCGLVERVPAGVQDAVEATIASAGNAGAVLARAWAHVHGFQPNDSGAYSDAVRAVEICAINTVQPRHSRATLGTVIGQMRADGNWSLPLRSMPGSTSSADLALSMCAALWEGHRDRHGSVNYTDVTHEEARAAVSLAATLVEWFSSGAIARRTP